LSEKQYLFSLKACQNSHYFLTTFIAYQVVFKFIRKWSITSITGSDEKF